MCDLDKWLSLGLRCFSFSKGNFFVRNVTGPETRVSPLGHPKGSAMGTTGFANMTPQDSPFTRKTRTVLLKNGENKQRESKCVSGLHTFVAADLITRNSLVLCMKLE